MQKMQHPRFYQDVNLHVAIYVGHDGSGVKLWTLDYENTGSNPVLRC